MPESIPPQDPATAIQLDACAVLGVEPGSDPAAIEEAYAKASQKYERQLGTETWIRQAIREAYRVLSSPDASATNSPSAVSRSGLASPAEAAQSPSSQPLRIFTDQLPLQNSTTCFILVNVLDIFMTFMLLRLGAIEANPIAASIERTWGFNGMIAFKLVLVAFVCVLSQIVARSNMRYAKGILWGGIAIVGAVVLYSLRLLVGPL